MDQASGYRVPLGAFGGRDEMRSTRIGNMVVVMPGGLDAHVSVVMIAGRRFCNSLNAHSMTLTGTQAGIGDAPTPRFFHRPADRVVTFEAGLGKLRQAATKADVPSDMEIFP